MSPLRMEIGQQEHQQTIKAKIDDIYHKRSLFLCDINCCRVKTIVV